MLLYLVRLADVLGVDLHDAALNKMTKNAEKHRRVDSVNASHELPTTES